MQKKFKRLLSLFFLWLTIYTILLLFYVAYQKNASVPTQSRFQPFKIISNYGCGCAINGSEPEKKMKKYANVSTSQEQRILLLIDSKAKSKTIEYFFNFFKIPIRIEVHSPVDRLLLELDGRGRYSLIIFENYRTYHFMSSHEKRLLEDYCAKHSTGVISFLNLDKQAQINFTNFIAIGGQTVNTLSFTESITRKIAKIGCEHNLEPKQQANWTLLDALDPKATPLLKARTTTGKTLFSALLIGPKHAVFGMRPEHWMVKIALLDVVNHFLPTIHQENLDRFIQIDIDDVFVGATGSRFLPEDVQASIETQIQLRQAINNFTFTLGFSGYYFRHGNELEMQADELLLAKADQFYWFPHMWRHNHAQEHSPDYLLALMAQNRMFANNSGLSTTLDYAISPQHSGVYPIYQPLYEGWRQIWNIKVTATEEYPHLKPATLRKAFVYSNISVLPRQTCGLFTHTQFFHAYPDGFQLFLDNIYGGDLFTTILMNKYSIFMTHQQNYVNDRLGAFTFLNLVLFLKCWTNLRLNWVPPKELAKLYFQQYPDEQEIRFSDICADKRHKRMLPANFTCANRTLPNLIILGPQKTGTTALAMFLRLHPNISTNAPIPRSFEELQFFAGPNYAKGVEWYTDKFANQSKSSTVIFEKTANYFDNPKVPEAIHALLPNAKLLVILDDPVRRAYSWYQHMRAHNDTIALKFTADEVFMLTNNTEVDKLKRRALWPGLFAKHLDRWLDFFSPSEIILVDAEKLRTEPHFVLRNLFNRLELLPLEGLAHKLKYSPDKGFYCLMINNNTNDANNQKLRCLGSSKGRQYETMSNRLRQHLESYFSGPNAALKELLRKYRFPVPSFLLTT